MTRFIFRQVDYRDLEVFLNDGEIRAPMHPSPQKCHQTSYKEITDRRGSQDFSVTPETVVNDYVQFYFSPITAFTFAISKGNVPVKCPQGTGLGQSCEDDRIFFVGRTESFRHSGLNFAFSSSALNTSAPLPLIERNLDKLDVLINWQVFEDFPKKAMINEIGYTGVCQYCNDRTEVRWMQRKPQRMAEFLVYDALPLDYIDCIIVKTDAMNLKLKALMDASDWNIPIYTKRGCYFG